MGNCENTEPSLKHRDLIERYALICSEALLRNADRFPFKQILGAAQDAEFERPIEVVISDTDPEEAYVFRVQEKGISVVPHSDCGDCECARSWNANIGYLRDVAQNSQAYINNPAKLDWGWIYDT